jgi:hypothetical protein
MRWRAVADLTAPDALAIAAFLQSLPPMRHAAPSPFGPGQPVTAAGKIDNPYRPSVRAPVRRCHRLRDGSGNSRERIRHPSGARLRRSSTPTTWL